MQRFAFAVSLCFCGLTVLSIPPRASAQERNVTVGIAYQYLRVDDASWPRGVSGDVVVDLSPRWAAVAEIDGSWTTTQVFNFEQTASALAVGGGLRWTITAFEKVRPYVHALVGAQRDALMIDRFGSDTQTHFAVQPGGGIAVGLTRRVAAFTQLDWRRVSRDTDDRNALHVRVGVRLTLR